MLAWQESRGAVGTALLALPVPAATGTAAADRPPAAFWVWNFGVFGFGDSLTLHKCPCTVTL